MPEQPDSPDGLEFTEAWTAEVSSEYVRDVAFARIDARPVAVAVAGTELTVWDLESGERLTPAPGLEAGAGAGADQGPDTGPGAPGQAAHLSHVAVTDIAGSPVAVTVDAAGGLQAWDLRSGARQGPTAAGFGGRVQDLAAASGTGAGLALVARGAGSTSSLYAVPVADGAVEVRDVATGKQVRRLQHNGYTAAVAVGEHDGRALAVASANYSASPLIDSSDTESSAFVWDVETGERVGEILEPEQVEDLIGSVAVGSVEGRMVVVGASGDGLRVWYDGAPRPQAHIPISGIIGCVVWAGSPDRPLVLVGGGALRPGGRCWLEAWDPRDWRLLGRIEPGSGRLTRCVPAPGGRVILPWVRSVKVLRYAGG
jgi:hypothetical protein